MLNGIARPFGMLLMFLYDLVSNYGVAIFLFAIVIKAILLPFQMKSKRGMIQQARLQPKIAELQKKHGDNKAKINEEMMKLYKAEGVNPASGCIWGFLPLPIMLALFQVIRQPITIMMGVAAEEYTAITELLQKLDFTTDLSSYYEQIAQSQFITKNFNLFESLSASLRKIDFNFVKGLDFGLTPQYDFLWNSDIARYGTWLAGFAIFLIPLISGGVQFLSAGINRKLNPPAAAVEGQAKSMNTMMMLMPLFSVYIAFITPAALGFYWTVSTVLQIIQDIWLTKVYTKKIEAEEAVKSEERRKKEAEIEAKRLETERKKAEGIVERNPNTSKRKKQKSGKQEQLEKAAEWQKKNTPTDEETVFEPSRVGKRRYARGRAYDPDRYAGVGEAGDEDALAIASASSPSDDIDASLHALPADMDDIITEDDEEFDGAAADADDEYDDEDGSDDDDGYDEDDEDDSDEDEYADDDEDDSDEDEYDDNDDDNEDEDDSDEGEDDNDDEDGSDEDDE